MTVLGVLTKPDAPGSTEWAPFLQVNNHLPNGYYCIMIPNAVGMPAGSATAGELEMAYLCTHYPWNEIERNRIGTGNLGKKLLFLFQQQIIELRWIHLLVIYSLDVPDSRRSFTVIREAVRQRLYDVDEAQVEREARVISIAQSLQTLAQRVIGNESQVDTGIGLEGTRGSSVAHQDVQASCDNI